MRHRVGLRSVSVLLLAVGLGAWPAVTAAQTVKVGAVVPLTGRYAAGGAQVRAGYEIAVEDVNRTGGVGMPKTASAWAAFALRIRSE
ncbi:MAG TPA: ABC transporter substrate-binding protein [Methylomirabilota bacterium]|nr:ABC transporter substrate-binding protein [Methylomirabilota bacterium]